MQNNEIGESVVHWPSPPIEHEHERARSVPPSLKTRSITDPDRINEYHRQKELELKAMRRKEEEAMAWEEKQVINLISNREFHPVHILLSFRIYHIIFSVFD